MVCLVSIPSAFGGISVAPLEKITLLNALVDRHENISDLLLKIAAAEKKKNLDEKKSQKKQGAVASGKDKKTAGKKAAASVSQQREDIDDDDDQENHVPTEDEEEDELEEWVLAGPEHREKSAAQSSDSATLSRLSTCWQAAYQEGKCCSERDSLTTDVDVAEEDSLEPEPEPEPGPSLSPSTVPTRGDKKWYRALRASRPRTFDSSPVWRYGTRTGASDKCLRLCFFCDKMQNIGPLKHGSTILQ